MDNKIAETAVIIPNYNGLKFMDRCIASLKRQISDSFRVIIVDNGSKDGSKEYLEKLEHDKTIGFPLTCIYLSENTGFSGAVNAGLKEAEGSEYAVLLNNDTDCDPKYLNELIKPLKNDLNGKIAAVSPKMVKMYEDGILDDAGDGYCVLGWAFQKGVGQREDTARFNKTREVFSACAGAAAYKMSALKAIRYGKESGEPYFDPLHFAYLEDVDVSFRLRILGYRIIYEPKARVLHVGSGTSGSRYNDFKVRLAARNTVFLNYKNMPILMLLINLPFILTGMLIKLLFFLRIGFGRAYIEGIGEGLKGIGKCRTHKVFFKPDRILNYVDIEIRLIADTFSYMRDLSVRTKAKLANRLKH